MEQPTHREGMAADNERSVLEAQIRGCYGRAAYSHKVHEKCADIYQGRLLLIKMAQIILAAITTGGLIITLFGETQVSTVVAAFASTTLLAINLYTKEHDLGELAQKHANTAGDLWNVRESYLSLIADLTSGSESPSTIRQKRNELQETLKNIYQAAPRTMPKAYAAAQTALKLNEELTFSDKEIDGLLPALLRKTGDGGPGCGSEGGGIRCC